jgi:transcriptional regulator with XRE-family HTH domain
MCQVEFYENVGGPPMTTVLDTSMPFRQQSMKARLLLARNIHAILTARKETQTALAFYCRRKLSWINKILAGKRPMHIDDFDRVADFLGIGVYQLFQPGITALTERRRPGDRRAARDRRIGHAERTVALRETHLGTGATNGTASNTSAAAELHALVLDFQARANSLLARADLGGQAPRAGKAVTKARRRRQPARGSNASDVDA